MIRHKSLESSEVGHLLIHIKSIICRVDGIRLVRVDLLGLYYSITVISRHQKASCDNFKRQIKNLLGTVPLNFTSNYFNLENLF